MINANIFMNKKYWGEMTLTETYEPLSWGQLSLFEHLRGLFYKYLKHNESYYLSNNGSFVPQQLLEGSTQNDDIVDYFLSKKGWKKNDQYYLIVWDPVEANALSSLSYATHYFNKSLSFIYEGKTISIIHNLDYPYKNRNFVSAIHSTIKHITSHLGISMPFHNFTHLPMAYSQSLLSIKYGKINNVLKDYYLYEDYYFSHLIDTLKSNDNYHVETFCDPNIIKLREYDKKKGSDLLKTLLIYLKYSQNGVKTSEVLFIHRNTLNYRLKIIKKITGIDLNRVYNIDHLLLSCMLIYHHSISVVTKT